MKTVLFVCVENSNRSQMAEAFARMLGGDRVLAASAGSRPSGRINPKAIAAMYELGYDLTALNSTRRRPARTRPARGRRCASCRGRTTARPA